MIRSSNTFQLSDYVPFARQQTVVDYAANGSNPPLSQKCAQCRIGQSRFEPDLHCAPASAGSRNDKQLSVDEVQMSALTKSFANWLRAKASVPIAEIETWPTTIRSGPMLRSDPGQVLHQRPLPDLPKSEFSRHRPEFNRTIHLRRTTASKPFKPCSTRGILCWFAGRAIGSKIAGRDLEISGVCWSSRNG
jgi:hypothetical protein